MKNVSVVTGVLVGKNPLKNEVLRQQVLEFLIDARDGNEESEKQAVSSCVVAMMQDGVDSVDVSKLAIAAIVAFPNQLVHVLNSFTLHLIQYLDCDKKEPRVPFIIEGFAIGLIEASIELNGSCQNDMTIVEWRKHMSHILANFLIFLSRKLSCDDFYYLSKEMAGRLSNLAPKYVYFVGVEELCKRFKSMFVGDPPPNELFTHQQPTIIWQILGGLTSRCFLQLPFKDHIGLLAGRIK